MEDALRSADIYPRQWADFKLAMLGLAAAAAFMGLLLVYWLYKKKNPATVKAAIVVVWATGPLVQVLSAAIIDFYFEKFFLDDVELGRFAGGVIASVIFAGIWTLYFLKSKRVRNTYYGYPVSVTKKRKNGKMRELAQGSFAVVWMFYLFAIAILQVVLGFKGIEYGLGFWWAIAALFVFIFFRFTIPMLAGTFYYLYAFEGWNFFLALLVAVPGLILWCRV